MAAEPFDLDRDPVDEKPFVRIAADFPESEAVFRSVLAGIGQDRCADRVEHSPAHLPELRIVRVQGDGRIPRGTCRNGDLRPGGTCRTAGGIEQFRQHPRRGIRIPGVDDGDLRVDAPKRSVQFFGNDAETFSLHFQDLFDPVFAQGVAQGTNYRV